MFILKIRQKGFTGWYTPIISEPLSGDTSAALALAAKEAAKYPGDLPTTLVIEDQNGPTFTAAAKCANGCAAAIYEAVKKGGAK